MECTRKKIKKFILNFFLELVDASPFSRKSTGMMLRTIHTIVPFFFVILLLLTKNKNINYIVLTVIILISFLFVFFKGCILSMIETKLLDDDYNVIDPFLELFNIPITNEKRFIVMKYLGGLYIIFIASLIFINTYK